MKALKRGKFRFTVLRFSRPAKSVLILMLCVAVFRLLEAAGASGKLDGLLYESVSNGGFSRAVLGFELGAPLKMEGRQAFDIIFAELPFFFSNGRGASDADFREKEEASAQLPEYITHDEAPERPVIILPDQMRAAIPDEPSAENAVRAITISPDGGKGYEAAGEVLIKNEAGLDFNIAEMLGEKLPVKFSGSGPHVLIIHTHGSEAYTPDPENIYIPTDPERTEDKRFNVVRIGDELEKQLSERGISVLHDRSLYDYPSYSGSYTRALKAIGSQMKKTPSIKMVIDIHRDSMTAKDGSVYKTVCEIDGRQVSQIMLVVGSNAGGLPHDSWKSNLTAAVKLQKIAQEKYPGLMRPINLRKERFNQHATKGSMLVEIGTSGNTLDESLRSVRLFADILSSLLENQ